MKEENRQKVIFYIWDKATTKEAYTVKDIAESTGVSKGQIVRILKQDSYISYHMHKHNNTLTPKQLRKRKKNK